MLKTTTRAAELGPQNIKMATTYGADGVRSLDKVGTATFVKLLSRGSKVVYKGDIFNLMARLLNRLPSWLLYLAMSVGILVWLPRRLLFKAFSRRQRDKAGKREQTKQTVAQQGLENA